MDKPSGFEAFNSFNPEHAAQPSEGDGSLIILALLALVAGAAAGLAGGLFRLALEQADRLRNLLIGWAHGQAIAGLLFVVVSCSVATLIAAWLVRRFSPHAAGSGIPHVEAVLRAQLPPARYGLAPVKFVGGVLAIGSGLALGREGPSVQMGASIAIFIGRVFRRGWPDCRVLLAAGAGAGLATAFNAPLAGAVFVLEELVQRFEHRIAIAALAASATAIAVARILLGDEPDFHVGTLGYAGAETRPLFFVLGGLAGLSAGWLGLLLAWLGAGMRLRSALLPAQIASSSFRRCSLSDSDLAPSHMQLARRVAYLHRSWFWERSLACCSARPAAWHFPV